MNNDLHFSSKYSEWQTPKKLYDYFDREYKFSIDVACTLNNCLASDGFYYPAYNALDLSWADHLDCRDLEPSCFMNPPYGRGITEKWVKKAWEESERGVTTVCLLPARPDNKWFMDYCAHGEVIFLAGRLRFYDPNMSEEKRRYNKHGDLILDPAPFPSCIVIFGPEILPKTVYWSGSRGMFD